VGNGKETDDDGREEDHQAGKRFHDGQEQGKKTPNELYLEDCTSCACVNPNLCCDTMLGICNLHYQGAKGHIYSTCTGHKYAGNHLTDGKNTIYNIHLTISITSDPGLNRPTSVRDMLPQISHGKYAAHKTVYQRLNKSVLIASSLGEKRFDQ
jgi:hypothetical protein